MVVNAWRVTRTICAHNNARSTPPTDMVVFGKWKLEIAECIHGLKKSVCVGSKTGMNEDGK